MIRWDVAWSFSFILNRCTYFYGFGRGVRWCGPYVSVRQACTAAELNTELSREGSTFAHSITNIKWNQFSGNVCVVELMMEIKQAARQLRDLRALCLCSVYFCHASAWNVSFHFMSIHAAIKHVAAFPALNSDIYHVSGKSYWPNLTRRGYISQHAHTHYHYHLKPVSWLIISGSRMGTEWHKWLWYNMHGSFTTYTTSFVFCSSIWSCRNNTHGMNGHHTTSLYMALATSCNQLLGHCRLCMSSRPPHLHAVIACSI